MTSYSKRQSSSIINIRIFHNWIKRELINQAAIFLRDNYNIYNPKLLDLAVGKGGDILKWYDSNINFVIGFDIDKSSIYGPDGAIFRYKKLMRQLKPIKIPDYRFFVMDLSDPDNLYEIEKIVDRTKFNLISCQFAIHYFFKSERNLDTLIRIVARYIDKNGFFIGTTIDGSKLINLFKKKDQTKQIKNDLYDIKLEFNISNIKNYGNKYNISLGKKTEKGHYFTGRESEEYLVNIDLLKSVCKKYGLKFLDTINFEQWYKVYLRDNPNLESKYKLNEIEKEFSFLNFSFVFIPDR